ncbi:DUF5779 family protein [Halapricum hydrolyticum]|uniref:DUF5779 family protein n=1 Tax=Halapricum hydrolyticum TaxID=2979991 RepID=A0AAE3IAI8_9EURY|nr:DUF5779 family protein [Halapricum hydrolyticum]MCU4718365.1 DUF5779 family protein [Halapricum hydrolyticum]MCU4726522.1 DUF5779 family protein [Halapricum hydrolyticum]
MAEFDLDLQAVEDKLEGGEERDSRIVLDILDGSTPDAEWIELLEDDAVLVLSVDGNVNELAAGFARDVRDMGGELVHFRGFLIVAPPGVSVDTDRLD